VGRQDNYDVSNFLEEGVVKLMRYFLLVIIILQLTPCVYAVEVLYTEQFTGEGDVTEIGWQGIYDSGGSSGGVTNGFGWVWHSGLSSNIIYTNEYTVDANSSVDVRFSIDLRRHSFYGTTPQVSIAVQVDSNWYVSKTIFTETTTTFTTKTLDYDPNSSNWDMLNIATLVRGSTAGLDLPGDITGFGLYSNSQNVGSSCTAEYDNFTIIKTEPIRTPDFNGSGAVDLQDFVGLASSWISSEGQARFNEVYDLDLDTMVDMNDLVLFAQNWLVGVFYPFTPQESQRKKISFNTGWKFYRGDISGDAAKAPSYDDSSWQSVNVPHAPVITPLRVQWPGPGTEETNWYRKHFMLDSAFQNNKIFIEFEGADQTTDVWINDTYLLTHYGAYLPFTVDITDHVTFSGMENVIAVKVDERQDDDIPAYGQWLSSGGLYRDVWMHITDKLHVTDAVYADMVAGGGLFVTYPEVNAAQASVQIKTHILNEHPTSKNCTLKSYIVGDNDMVVAEVSDTQTIAASGDFTFTQMATIMSPALWHPDHPNLYTLYTYVYDDTQIADIYQTLIGIRRISFSLAGGFTINGEPLTLRGTNRVQDYPYLGWAMGNLGQRRDAELLREAGFNYIRTSHCPPDASFMDACDELGIVVMDEIPAFQYVGGSLFKSRSYQNMRDMIHRDRNHPCVIAWELSLNETNFDTTYAQTAMDIGHAEYPGDQCYVSAWKHDSIYDIYIATPTAGARTYSGSKPLIVSEHGHWEYGGGNSTSDVHRAADIIVDSYPGGEGPMLQQAWNHQESHHLNRGLSNMCGDGLWVGIDYGAWPSGVYDFLRLPKFSAYFWQSQRNPNLIIPGIDSGPMVYIANYWTASSPSDVTVYSNCEQVKLYINDVLQDTRGPDTAYPTSNLLHPPFTFSGLTFQSGELKAEGLIGGELVATDIVETPGSPNHLEISFATDTLKAGGDVIFIYTSVLDNNGVLVSDASNNIHIDISGPATVIGPVDLEAEAGIASFLVRTIDSTGNITITTTASGLIGDAEVILSQ
jgi:hypothetical protein